MKHGESNARGKRKATAEYTAWQLMKDRCFNQRCKDYKNYGARGITIDPSWMDYSQFLVDMGRKPAPHLTLERIQVNGNYEPSNCIWSTKKVQTRNRRCVKLTMQDAASIRRLYATGQYTQEILAHMFSVCQPHISDVVRQRRRIWT